MENKQEIVQSSLSVMIDNLVQLTDEMESYPLYNGENTLGTEAHDLLTKLVTLKQQAESRDISLSDDFCSVIERDRVHLMDIWAAAMYGDELEEFCDKIFEMNEAWEKKKEEVESRSLAISKQLKKKIGGLR